MSEVRIEIALHMIDRLLIQKNMSRKELADRLSVTKTAVTMWLNGSCEISERRIIQIAKILGVDSRVIFPDRRFQANEKTDASKGD